MSEQQDADALFDVPSADPDIRRNYEAALGRCILAFNQLDNLLGTVLGTVLARLARTDIQKERVNQASFSQRVDFLDILKHSVEGNGLTDIPVSDLRSIAGDRNLLVHAHFEQNPIDGSYCLVNSKGQTAQHYTPQRIDGVASRIQEIWMAVRYAEAHYDFADNLLSTTPPPSSSLT